MSILRRLEPVPSPEPSEEPSDGMYRAVPQAYGAIRAITAAAESFNLKNKREVELLKARRGGERWQGEAWDYYDAVGEIKYAVNLTASVISRIRLYIGYVETMERVPVGLDEARTADEFTEIDDDIAKKCQRAYTRLMANSSPTSMMRMFGLNFSVTGECYLVEEPARLGSGTPHRWRVYSTDSIDVTGTGEVTIKRRANAKREEFVHLGTDAFVGRMWREHPRWPDEADSSLRSILELCDELLLLNRAARAIEKSRLNAGAMYIPDGLSVAAMPEVTDEDGETDSEDTTFEDDLMDAMVTPISDESAPSAVVPLLIRGPAELADKIKQFKFERSFDEQMNARAERVLERILTSIDVPKDVVSGLASVKYANAIHINESLYRAHVEPLALLICDSLTQVYLRPVLKSYGVPDEVVDRLVFWYDPSDIVIKPDRSQAADAGYDRKALSGRAWRNAHGFSEGDKPSVEELLLRIAIERGPVSPEIMEQLLTRLDPTLMEQVRTANQEGSPAPLPSDVVEVVGGEPVTPVAPPSAGTENPPGRPREPAPSVNPRAPIAERESIPTP